MSRLNGWLEEQMNQHYPTIPHPVDGVVKKIKKSKKRITLQQAINESNKGIFNKGKHSFRISSLAFDERVLNQSLETFQVETPKETFHALETHETNQGALETNQGTNETERMQEIHETHGDETYQKETSEQGTSEIQAEQQEPEMKLFRFESLFTNYSIQPTIGKYSEKSDISHQFNDDENHDLPDETQDIMENDHETQSNNQVEEPLFQPWSTGQSFYRPHRLY